MSPVRRAIRAVACLSLCLLVLLAARPAEAAKPSRRASWGLGFMLGEPTAFTVKHWLGGPNAIDLALGTGPGLRLHGDYLWGLSRLASSRDIDLDLYVGAGGAVGLGDGWCGFYRGRRFCDDDRAWIGARIPFGLDLLLRQAPLEFGLEVAPGIAIGEPGVGGLLDVAFIVRVLL